MIFLIQLDKFICPHFLSLCTNGLRAFINVYSQQTGRTGNWKIRVVACLTAASIRENGAKLRPSARPRPLCMALVYLVSEALRCLKAVICVTYLSMASKTITKIKRFTKTLRINLYTTFSRQCQSSNKWYRVSTMI